MKRSAWVRVPLYPSGYIAQLVEHRTRVAIGSNPISRLRSGLAQSGRAPYGLVLVDSWKRIMPPLKTRVQFSSSPQSREHPIGIT